MSDPIFDNTGKQVAYRVGGEVRSRDGKTVYDLDPAGNLVDRTTGQVVGHLIPVGEYLPNGKPAPGQTLF